MCACACMCVHVCVCEWQCAQCTRVTNIELCATGHLIGLCQFTDSHSMCINTVLFCVGM